MVKWHYAMFGAAHGDNPSAAEEVGSDFSVCGLVRMIFGRAAVHAN
jgi:hypothetical protein